MHYRKFRAAALFTGHQLLDDGQMLVADESGVIRDIIPADQDTPVLPGMICPGFINCHGHLELSHLKGLIPEKTGLADFVLSVMAQRFFPEEEIYDAIQRGEEEMLANGIVAAGDICNTALSIPQKRKERLVYYNFVEVSGWNPAVALARFEHYQHVLQEFSGLPGSRSALAPHAPYSVSDLLWDHISPGFENRLTSMHNQEAAWENELFLYGTGDAHRIYRNMKSGNPSFQPTGKTSLQTCLPKLRTAGAVILVHNTFTSAADLAFCRKQAEGPGLFWCFCPNANLYIENRLPDISLWQQLDERLVLGTDSLASNQGLSILEEIKTLHRACPHWPVEKMLRWATLNGARALGMEDRLGSFEAGKQPGILHIEQADGITIQSGASVHRLL